MALSPLPCVLSSKDDHRREVGEKAARLCSPRPWNFHSTLVQQLLPQRKRAQGPLWLLWVAVSAQTGCQLIYMQWLINVVARFIYCTRKAEEWLLHGWDTQRKSWAAKVRENSAKLPEAADVTLTVTYIWVPCPIPPVQQGYLECLWGSSLFLSCGFGKRTRCFLTAPIIKLNPVLPPRVQKVFLLALRQASKDVLSCSSAHPAPSAERELGGLEQFLSPPFGGCCKSRSSTLSIKIPRLEADLPRVTQQ